MLTNENIRNFAIPVLAGVVVIAGVIGIGLTQTIGKNVTGTQTAEPTANITLIAPQSAESTGGETKRIINEKDDGTPIYKSDMTDSTRKETEVNVSAAPEKTPSAEADDDSEDSGDD